MTFFSKKTTDVEDMYKLIYNTYRGRVFAYIDEKVSDRNDILDIMQNVFLHLWQYRNALGGTNTESIIMKTCNQEISNFYRTLNKQPLGNDDHLLDQPDDTEDQLLAKNILEDQLDAIKESIEMIPLSRQHIFTMNKLDGISQEKIAHQLNLSKKAVKKQIGKAMLFLKEQHNNS